MTAAPGVGGGWVPPPPPAIRRTDIAARAARIDANIIDAIREHIDRAERDGATVVRIERIRAIIERRAR